MSKSKGTCKCGQKGRKNWIHMVVTFKCDNFEHHNNRWVNISRQSDALSFPTHSFSLSVLLFLSSRFIPPDFLKCIVRWSHIKGESQEEWNRQFRHSSTCFLEYYNNWYISKQLHEQHNWVDQEIMESTSFLLKKQIEGGILLQKMQAVAIALEYP